MQKQRTATVQAATVLGVDAFPIDIEVDLAHGLPAFQVVGLPDGAVRESRERVRAAMKNSGFELYRYRITVNLAPADLRKEGASYDLPLALALLIAQGSLPAPVLAQTLCIGELGLDGQVRGVPGVLPIALLAKKLAVRYVLMPQQNFAEANVVEGLSIIPVASLRDAVEKLGNIVDKPPQPLLPIPFLPTATPASNDFAEVRGQHHAKRALEVAAAGGHNLLMVGPPGSGKTMLAARLPSILPTVSFNEALEITKIYSVAGLLPSGTALMMQRPFRSPHHSISDAGLVGGGAMPKPGEVSLAHHGVLFLDELPEFKKQVLEVLRQPLEDGRVAISRATMRLTYPAKFMLIASMNPCPCGYLSDPTHTCNCNPTSIERYQSRLSGPLLDRIDIHIDVPAIKYRELSTQTAGETSQQIRLRVETARSLQRQRFTAQTQVFCNAQMGPRELANFCRLNSVGHQLLERAVEKLGMSARATTRILKVARTIADLASANDIDATHLAEAIQYRTLDRKNTAR